MTPSTYLARRYLGFLGVLAGCAALLTLGLAPALSRSDALPSPWSAGAPLALAAALWTRIYTRALGEHVALAQTGASRLRLVVPAALCAAAAQLLLCLPGGTRAPPAPLDGRTRAVLGVGGDLLLLDDDHGDVLWPGAGTPERLPPRAGPRALPASFTPEPRNRSRLRRQLFLIHAPQQPSDHPLDPGFCRWLWVAATPLAVLLILGAERRRWCWLALSPFAACLVWL